MINWLSQDRFSIDGVNFTIDTTHGGARRFSERNNFTIVKSRDFFDRYAKIQGENFSHILELGVYQGGSFVFMDKFFKPKKISAIELSTKRIPALDEYVDSTGDRAKIHYGTSQSDVARLEQVVREDFGGQLDLVVDDASHFYDHTKTSFMTLFPLLRPGGLYIIEDWGWSFQAPHQTADGPWFDQGAPVNLLFELLEEMTLNNTVAEMTVIRPMALIRKPDRSLPSVGLFERHGHRGREFPKL